MDSKFIRLMINFLIGVNTLSVAARMLTMTVKTLVKTLVVT